MYEIRVTIQKTHDLEITASIMSLPEKTETVYDERTGLCDSVYKFEDSDEMNSVCLKIQKLIQKSDKFKCLDYKTKGTGGSAVFGNFRTKKPVYTMTWGKQAVSV